MSLKYSADIFTRHGFIRAPFESGSGEPSFEGFGFDPRDCRSRAAVLIKPVFGRPNGWLGREDSSLDMANWNRMLSPVREAPQHLFSLKFIGPSKRWNFENRTESAESRASEINGPFGE
jgi:hypothetical protein